MANEASQSDSVNNVVSLRAKTREKELERLKRITGLSFEQLPNSLIQELDGLELAQGDGEELILRALNLWNENDRVVNDND